MGTRRGRRARQAAPGRLVPTGIQFANEELDPDHDNVGRVTRASRIEVVTIRPRLQPHRPRAAGWRTRVGMQEAPGRVSTKAVQTVHTTGSKVRTSRESLPQDKDADEECSMEDSGRLAGRKPGSLGNHSKLFGGSGRAEDGACCDFTEASRSSGDWLEERPDASSSPTPPGAWTLIELRLGGFGAWGETGAAATHRSRRDLQTGRPRSVQTLFLPDVARTLGTMARGWRLRRPRGCIGRRSNCVVSGPLRRLAQECWTLFLRRVCLQPSNYGLTVPGGILGSNRTRRWPLSAEAVQIHRGLI